MSNCADLRASSRVRMASASAWALMMRAWLAREEKHLAIVLESPSRETAADYLKKIKALIIQYDR